jgi:hypothetical protein
MSKRLTEASVALGLLTLLVSTATPAFADDFCTQLKSIVADASTGFSTLRGAQSKKDETFTYFNATGAPQDAASCSIEVTVASASGQHTSAYACEFPTTLSNKGAAVKKLAGRIEHCLGIRANPDDVTASKDFGQVLLDFGSDVSLQVTAGPAEPTIAMVITSLTH